MIVAQIARWFYEFTNFPQTFVTFMTYGLEPVFEISDFCESHSDEPYSTWHRLPTLDPLPSCLKCDTINVIHIMWYTMWPRQYTMWRPRWEDDLDGKVTKLSHRHNHERIFEFIIGRQILKHTAAITCWETTRRTYVGEPTCFPIFTHFLLYDFDPCNRFFSCPKRRVRYLV